MLFRRSALCTPFQFMSSYLIESLQIAFRLDSESDSITRLSISFCLSASRIAPNSAFVFLLILLGVCHKLCLWGVSLFGFQTSLTLFSNSLAFFLQSSLPFLLPLQGV